MSEQEEPITLAELLGDEEVEFVVFKDGDEVTTFEDFGAAVDRVLETVGLDVGVVQNVGGPRRPVYLSMAGVVETLLADVPDDVHLQLREKYSELIDRHGKLKDAAREADVTDDPMHAPGEIRAEADGVLYGIQAIEEVLNDIEGNDE